MTRSKSLNPIRKMATVGVLAGALALLLGACGSNNAGAGNAGSTTTTSHTSTSAPSGGGDPTSQLSALEAAPAGSLSVSETGSSLLYPLFSAWAQGYKAKWPNVSITTAATGSSTGISDAATGTADIGASDAYLPPADFTKYAGIENIPLAISAQQINYNLPTVPASAHLKLNGTILAEMYTGKITNWDDPAIANVNPGVKLPNLAVKPVHRSDGSGDTFLFTTYLSDSAPSAWTLGYDQIISWPTISNELSGAKNSGMIQVCSANPGCITYTGISYASKTSAAGLGQAMLENKAGNYELPTSASISAAAASFPSVPANGSISMIYGPAPAGYPIINYEYAIVMSNQSSAANAKAIVSVLAWAMDPDGGSAASELSAVNFQPLPSAALAVSVALLEKIS